MTDMQPVIQSSLLQQHQQRQQQQQQQQEQQQQGGPVVEKPSAKKDKKRRSKKSKRKESESSNINDDTPTMRTSATAENTNLSDPLAQTIPFPPTNNELHLISITDSEMHPSYQESNPEKKKSSKKKKKSSKRSSLQVSNKQAAAGISQQDAVASPKNVAASSLRQKQISSSSPATPVIKNSFVSSTAPLKTSRTQARPAKKRLSKFQQQQAHIMQELGVSQDDLSFLDGNSRAKNNNHDSFGEWDHSGGDLSCEDSTISDITFATYAGNVGSEKAAMLFAEQQKKQPAKQQEKKQPQLSMMIPRVAGRSSNYQSTVRNSGGMSSSLMEKAAILEDYEYDQEFEDEPVTAVVTRVTQPAAAAASRQVVKLEKWEMLSDDFDEAAFGQAIGGLRGPSAVATNDDFGGYASKSNVGAAAIPAGAGPNVSMTPEEHHSHQLLIRYLQSMGADPTSAEKIAKSFDQDQRMGGPARPAVVAAGPTGMQQQEQITFAANVQQQPYSSNHGNDNAAGRKLRMMSTDDPTPRNAARQGGPHRGSLTWDRFDQPGAVQIESRAFGAPYRPDTKKGKAEQTGTIAMLSDDFEELTTPSAGVPTLEAELVEAKDMLGDGASDLERNTAAIVYAESTPMNFKTLLKERSIRRPVILGTIVFVAIIVVSLSVTLTRQSSSGVASLTIAVPTGSPTSQPTRIENEFAEALAEVSGWEVLTRAGSPQLKALAWLSTFDEQVIETSDSRFVQRYALVVLYYSTGGGESWLEEANWLDPSMHECDWGPSTIECEQDPSNRRILVTIDLSRNGLSGELPPEVGALTQLKSLKLGKNQLGGSLPGEIFVPSLKTLETGANKITGAIPLEISSARDLAFLDLSFNELSSELPEQIFDLSNLFWLDLSFNQLNGTLSTFLGKMKRLTSFNVRSNILSGTIPQAFDDIPKLDFVLLDDNLLTGGLPPWSGALLTRQELTLSHNQLVGTIPDASSLGAIGGDFLSSIRLSTVDISFNRFGGTVPMIIALVPSLRRFDISGNSFVGEFPSAPGFWPGMEHLGLRENQFEGPVPSGFSNLLVHLDLGSNNLQGAIPVKLAAFPNLKYLSLSHNQLSSTIPTEIAELVNLQILQVRNCSLTGSIPNGLASNGAEYLDLGVNMLTGTIHPRFGAVSSLEKLSLDSNSLSGRIPPDLGSLDQLRVLTLDTNNLSGTIPSRLSLLPNLENFTAFDNRLVGSVPDGLCTLLPNLGFEDIGCAIECSCCSGRETICGGAAS